MTHHAKVDVYILAAIALAIVVFLMWDYWIAGPILLVLLLCAYPQSYETTARGLVVRTALAKLRIPYETISFVARLPKTPAVYCSVRIASGSSTPWPPKS